MSCSSIAPLMAFYDRNDLTASSECLNTLTSWRSLLELSESECGLLCPESALIYKWMETVVFPTKAPRPHSDHNSRPDQSRTPYCCIGPVPETRNLASWNLVFSWAPTCLDQDAQQHFAGPQFCFPSSCAPFPITHQIGIKVCHAVAWPRWRRTCNYSWSPRS